MFETAQPARKSFREFLRENAIAIAVGTIGAALILGGIAAYS